MNLYQTDNDLRGAPREPYEPSTGSIGKGMVLVILFTVGFLVGNFVMGFMPVLGAFLAFGSFGIGVTQILWIAPMAYFFRHQKRTVQGLLIGAGLVFLLNGACFAILLTSASMH